MSGAPKVDRAEIRRRFTYYPPSPDRANLHIEVRHVLSSAGERLASLLPEGREKSTAITKLEEAMFWANAALARQAAE